MPPPLRKKELRESKSVAEVRLAKGKAISLPPYMDLDEKHTSTWADVDTLGRNPRYEAKQFFRWSWMYERARELAQKR